MHLNISVVVKPLLLTSLTFAVLTVAARIPRKKMRVHFVLLQVCSCFWYCVEDFRVPHPRLLPFFCCVILKVWTGYFGRERKNTDFFWPEKALGAGKVIIWFLTFSMLMALASRLILRDFIWLIKGRLY